MGRLYQLLPLTGLMMGFLYGFPIKSTPKGEILLMELTGGSQTSSSASVIAETPQN
jgi:hypothetical protein